MIDMPPAAPARTSPRPRNERMNVLRSVPFFAAHLIPLAAIATGVTVQAVVIAVALFYGRMFFITAGYHRYFAHRSYRMGRVAQFLMAAGATTALQKGPLWWAAHHRDHHRWADTDRDVHSPERGFWWSHVGWILCDRFKRTEHGRIRDFGRYPELRLLDRFHMVPPVVLAVAVYLVAGAPGLVIGFFASTVALWHGTFTVNSLAHVFGRRRYATSDTSRNSALMVLWTMGEGWHNNHHHYQSSVRQGFFWWEFDPTYLVLRMLSRLRIVRGLREPSPAVLMRNRIDLGDEDVAMTRRRRREAVLVDS